VNAFSAEPVFRVDRLTIAYAARKGKTTAPLSEFSLAIGAGEITCLLGPSGCGKTTLLKALGGFVPHSSGRIMYEDQVLTGTSKDIVMIFQENNLFPWLTVRQNIAFGQRYQKTDKAEKLQALKRMIELVALHDAAGSYPAQLSGGMRQRAAIARALVVSPKVLLLDEPFSALDISLRRRMNQLLRDIWRETGTTMVMVTHNVEEAITVGQRVVVLGGKPATVLLDGRTSANEYRDRYDPAFLRLQKQIEGLMD
jgi:ABC-type nitrate/sulfonate/bicarbonate transport system ATPase subunit